MELLLPVSLPLSKHIGVQGIRLPREVPEELEVDLVVIRALRRHLQAKNADNNF